MAYSSDDLTPFFMPAAGKALRGQGTIIDWNPETFENVVQFRGEQWIDVPVLDGVSALTFLPGDQVVLDGWEENGLSSWYISGRVFPPGAGRAEQQVQFMKEGLAKEVSAEVFAERIQGQQVLDLVQTTQTSFDDLSGSYGPEVTVNVSDSGIMIVQISALMVNGARTAGGPGQTFAEMGFAISGESTVAASANRALIVGGPVSSAQPAGITMGATKTVYVSGLNPGEHTVTAKYTTEVFDVTAAGAFFSRRDLVVTAF